MLASRTVLRERGPLWSSASVCEADYSERGKQRGGEKPHGCSAARSGTTPDAV